MFWSPVPAGVQGYLNVQNPEMWYTRLLIAELTAIQNVLMPTMKNKEEKKRCLRAEMLLEQFGLKDKMNRYPKQIRLADGKIVGDEFISVP